MRPYRAKVSRWPVRVRAGGAVGYRRVARPGVPSAAGYHRLDRRFAYGSFSSISVSAINRR